MVPAVSVVIPTYNRWPMLQDAIASVLAQTFENYELIVVDDGSTDNTLGELRLLGTSFQVIPQAHRGVAAARNRGVKGARGRYLAFLDSDDLWVPRKLAVQVAFMDAHPDVKICQTEEIWIRRGARVNPKARHRKPSGDIFKPSLDLCLVSPSAVMLTRELYLEVGGFDENLPVCEDYDLWLRVAVNHDVRLLPQALVVKRGGHVDQLSRSVWGMDRYRVMALQKLLRSALSDERREWALMALDRKVSILAAGARKRGHEADALTYEAIRREFNQEFLYEWRASSRVCRSAGFPPSDHRALVGPDPSG
ncbi:MAG: glycosyltransferase family 2 protein [Deltaproteobacteria bacterium]|nr:glycosyltransferase family 2 protein [Deltaproteobacteria bacterium]